MARRGYYARLVETQLEKEEPAAILNEPFGNRTAGLFESLSGDPRIHTGALSIPPAGDQVSAETMIQG